MIPTCGKPLGEENRSGLCKEHYIALATIVKNHPHDPRTAVVVRQVRARAKKG